MTMTFDVATPIDEPLTDTVPDLDDVEYPCVVCGRESGPYGGRGRKPKRCPEHKTAATTGTRRATRVTGKDANLAAQATGVLSQLNGIIAIGLMAIGMNDTASAIAAHNDGFEEQANAALLTDPDLCRLILKGGVKSAKIGLGLAYVSMGVGVMPIAVEEARVKKTERLARKEAQEL